MDGWMDGWIERQMVELRRLLDGANLKALLERMKSVGGEEEIIAQKKLVRAPRSEVEKILSCVDVSDDVS
jgi:hypothetical protein